MLTRTVYIVGNHRGIIDDPRRLKFTRVDPVPRGDKSLAICVVSEKRLGADQADGREVFVESSHATLRRRSIRGILALEAEVVESML